MASFLAALSGTLSSSSSVRTAPPPSPVTQRALWLCSQLSACLLVILCLLSHCRPLLSRLAELGVKHAVKEAEAAAAVPPVRKDGDTSTVASAGFSPAGPSRFLSAALQQQPTPPSSSRRRTVRVAPAKLAIVSPLWESRSASSPSVAPAHQQSRASQSTVAQRGSRSSLLPGTSLSSLSAPPSPRSPQPSSELLSLSMAVLRRVWPATHVQEEPAALTGRIQLSNVLAAVFATISLVLFVTVPFLTAESLAFPSSSIASVCLVCPFGFMLVPALNELGHTVLSRLLLLLQTHTALLLFTVSWPGCGFSAFHYSTLPLSLVLFDASMDSLPFLLSLLIPLASNVVSAAFTVSASPMIASVNSLLSYVILTAILNNLLTQYRRNEASLLSASRSSRAAYTAMTSLMHSISHELRTPLNAVTGYTELLLLDHGLSSQQQDMVRTIADNADALTKLVSDFLTFSSSSHGQLRVEAEIVDVEEALDACISSHAIAAHRKGIELVYEVDDDVPALVLADGQRVREVLSNLITDSITASDGGCVHVSVGLGSAHAPMPTSAAHSSSSSSSSSPLSSFSSSSPLAASSRDDTAGALYPSTFTLRFEVTDEGPGVSAEQQKHLFQPFSTSQPSSVLDGSSSSSFGNGRGLGLAICHSLVHLMGGKIGVLSEMENGQIGSVFWFTVQVHQVNIGGMASAGVNLRSKATLHGSEGAKRRIVTVRESDETGDDDTIRIQASSYTPSPFLSLSDTSSSSLFASLPRHVLVVSANVTARNTYARILLQHRGWLISVCNDEQAARALLVASSPPAIAPRNLQGGSSHPGALKRALSTPAAVEEQEDGGHRDDTSPSRLSPSPPTPPPFDCVILDQTGSLELSTLQRFALAVQSRLQLPCLILRLSTATEGKLGQGCGSKVDTNGSCQHCSTASTPLTSPTNSEQQQEYVLLSELSTNGRRSSPSSSSVDSADAMSTSPSFSTPLLPRPPLLHKPHYCNVTPPVTHIAQLHALITVVPKPVRWSVLVEKALQLMERARQRKRDKKRQQTKQDDIDRQQAALSRDDDSPTKQDSPPQPLTVSPVSPQTDPAELSPQPRSQDVLTAGVLPPLPSVPAAALRSCTAQARSLGASAGLSVPSEGTSPAQPSASMLRSLDKLTAAARASSAPVQSTAIYHPMAPLMHARVPGAVCAERARSASSGRELVSSRRIMQDSGRSDSRRSGRSEDSLEESSEDGDDTGNGSCSDGTARTETGTSSPSTSSHLSSSSSASSMASQTSSCGSRSPPSCMSALRVLIAEDTVTNQKLITHMLRRIGVTHITIAPDGVQCVSIVRSACSEQQSGCRPFDLILMDLLMPNMDGWQATQTLRADGWDGPIVALSASAMKADRQRCDEVGCSGFLSKPVKLAVLKDTIQRMCLLGKSS